MTADLRTLISQSVKVADLGDRAYSFEGTARLDGKTITGSAGSKITRIDTGAGRESPGISVRGTGPKLTGVVEYVGTMPDGDHYVEGPDGNEAHHAVQIDGALNPVLDGKWNVHNHFGDAVTARTTRYAHDPWTNNMRLTGWWMHELGRHHVTLDASQLAYMAGMTMGRCWLSPVCIEPPGSPWGARKLTWLNTTITDPGGGWTLASKGVGGDDTVQDIYLGGIRCINRPFSVTVNPQPRKPGVDPPRRQRFKIVNCAGVGMTEQPQLVFRHVDGIYVRNVKQPCRTRLIRALDCTGIDADVPYLTN